MISDEDRYIEGAARYFFFAERFHWTPEQVDNMPAWLLDRLPAVAAIHDEIAEDRQRAAQQG